MTTLETTNNTSNKVTANRVLQVLDIFRELDSDMPMGEAVALVVIALGETRQDGGLTVTELGQRGGFALASASRYMKSLGRKNRRGEMGHEVVVDVRDPMDDRRKILRLTPKGSRLIARMKNVVGE